MANRKTSHIPVHQLIGYYGIGSIYELRSHWNERQSGIHSVMVAGLDFWEPNDMVPIHDPVMEHILNVHEFYAPPIDTEEEENAKAAVPVVRFPKWLVCDKCQRLGRVPQEFEDRKFSGPRCLSCRGRGRGIPARLVVACQPNDHSERQTGHIDDFPWVYWVHRGRSCADPQLKMETVPGASSLRGLKVVCLNPPCLEQHVERSLGDALLPEALSSFRCTGKRPWLDDQEPCGRRVRVIFRHASNVYFPDIVSAVSIPPFSTELYQQLQRRNGRIIRNIQRDHQRNRSVDWDRILEELREEEWWIKPFTDTQVIEALKELSVISDTDVNQYRMKERRALLAGYPETPRALFIADPIPKERLSANLASMVDQIVQVHRLREVRVLRGFRRISPAGQYAPISKNQGEPRSWLPAVELHGEGIYLEWNRETMNIWAQQPAVKDRIKPLISTVDDHVRERANSIAILVHTPSHLLIKQLALESGYGLGSLRERLYLNNPDDGEEAAGILIYAASTATGGTLGGLVRQGTPERIARLLESAYEAARWCSSDPLCIEHRTPLDDEKNLAACHACCLISETACEWNNQFLDRALVVGDLQCRELGFLVGRFDKDDKMTISSP